MAHRVAGEKFLNSQSAEILPSPAGSRKAGLLLGSRTKTAVSAEIPILTVEASNAPENSQEPNSQLMPKPTPPALILPVSPILLPKLVPAFSVEVLPAPGRPPSPHPHQCLISRALHTGAWFSCSLGYGALFFLRVNTLCSAPDDPAGVLMRPACSLAHAGAGAQRLRGCLRSCSSGTERLVRERDA